MDGLMLPILSDNVGNYQLPDPELVSYYTLEKERKIWLDGEVDINMLEYERLILRWNIEDSGKPANERKPIWLYLMNYGGDADMMWSFIDTIESSVTPVYTVNMGVCASAAGIIFLSGHKRFMLPRGRVVIHEGSASLSGDSTKVFDAADSYKSSLKAMKEHILKKTNIPAKLLNKKRNNDWELDSAFCLEHGVCDIIVKTMDEII